MIAQILAALTMFVSPAPIDDLCLRHGVITGQEFKAEVEARGWSDPKPVIYTQFFQTYVWPNYAGDKDLWIGFANRGGKLVLSGCEECKGDDCLSYPTGVKPEWKTKEDAQDAQKYPADGI